MKPAIIPAAVPASPLGRAPAFALLLSFSLFLTLMEGMRVPALAAAAIALLAAAGWFLIGTERPALSSAPAALALLAVALAGMAVIWARFSSVPQIPKRVEGFGVVIMSRQWGYSTAALVDAGDGFLDFFGGFASPNPPRYVLKLPPDSQIAPGDAAVFSGRSSAFKRARRPGDFDEFMFWRSKGASLAAESVRFRVIGRSFGFAAWRDALARRINETLPRLTAGYMTAAMTGGRDEYLSEFHGNAGTSHLLAVSGLHVGIVALICWSLLKGIKFRLWLVSLAVWFYVLMAGASPSSVRAAVMLQFAFLGRMFGQSGGTFNGVCFAGALMLAVNPWILWDVGWQLSVISVMTLSAVASLEVSSDAKWLLACPAAWLASSLPGARAFGGAPVAGIAANFFAVPIFTVLLPAAAALSIPSLAGLEWGRYPASACEAAFGVWEDMSDNITYLMPWRMDFSTALLIAGGASVLYLFARACGFARFRALVAALAGAACVYLIY